MFGKSHSPSLSSRFGWLPISFSPLGCVLVFTNPICLRSVHSLNSVLSDAKLLEQFHREQEQQGDLGSFRFNEMLGELPAIHGPAMAPPGKRVIARRGRKGGESGGVGEYEESNRINKSC